MGQPVAQQVHDKLADRIENYVTVDGLGTLFKKTFMNGANQRRFIIKIGIILHAPLEAYAQTKTGTCSYIA